MIQKQLVDKLALRLLEGEFAEGDTVKVDAADGELTFQRTKPPKRRPTRESRCRGSLLSFACAAPSPPRTNRPTSQYRASRLVETTR